MALNEEWGDAINTDYDPLVPIRNTLLELDGMTALSNGEYLILNSNYLIKCYTRLIGIYVQLCKARPLFLHNMIVDSALHFLLSNATARQKTI